MVGLQVNLLLAVPSRVGDHVVDEVKDPGPTHGRLFSHSTPRSPQPVIFSVLVEEWWWRSGGAASSLVVMQGRTAQWSG